MSFDWQTEETIQWDEEAEETPPPKSQPSKPRRRWPWLILILVIFLSGGMGGVYWSLTQRVEELSEDVGDDLIASYAVIEDAANAQDPELFATFLSGKDAEWALAWEQLVSEGDYQNRQLFGLDWQPVEPVTAVISHTINPQFNAAEIVTEHDYSYSIGNGYTETVQLRHTVVYRLGPDRWLLAPPEDEFWGPTIAKDGYYVSLTFPERDQEIARRLALEFNSKTAELCVQSTFECPEGFHWQVEFLTDPALLSSQADAVAYVDGEWRLRLPTPTLVGLPQDEAGFQAMARGYTVQLINPMMQKLSGIADWSEGAFSQAWLDWYLERLALRPYPLLPSNRQTLAEQGTTLQSGAQFWNSGEDATALTYAIIQFLIEELKISPKHIIQIPGDGQIPFYEDWLIEVSDGRYTPEELEQQWQTYLTNPP
ncbi:MAG: hypothetical protein GY796_28935 [Chloroflexi bacterium]|nr:hypothetical protein [Chloroflexota bacterium]